MKRKLLCLILSICMVASLSGCDDINVSIDVNGTSIDATDLLEEIASALSDETADEEADDAADGEVDDSESKDYSTGNPWVDSDILSNVENRGDVSLKDDFNLAVNREWILDNPIETGKNQNDFINSFENELNNRLLDILAEETSDDNHELELVQAYYNAFLDWESRDAAGGNPLMPYIEEIEGIKSYDDFAKYSAKSEITLGSIIDVSIGVSPEDSSQNILCISSPDVFLKDADNYGDLNNMSDYARLTREYQKTRVGIVLSKCGYSQDEIDSIFDGAIEFEKIVSKYCYTQNESYLSATMEALNNQIFKGDELEGYKWFVIIEELIKEEEIEDSPEYILYEKMDYFENLDEICCEDNLQIMKDYLLAHTASRAALYLDKECYYSSLDAYNKLLGTSGYQDEEQYALSYVVNSLGWPMSKLYCEKYVTDEDKQTIYDLITDIIAEYKEMLSSEEFLSDDTKAEAINKLNHIRIRCMYPDEWEDYSSVNLSDNCFENFITMASYETQKKWNEFEEPVDKDKWIVTPITMNAFYYSSDNSINILPGLIGDVLYNSEMPKEEVYAYIGVVIGHEISHAFDPDGATYDADGNYKNWWTDEDYENFDARTRKLVDYYDTITVWDGFDCNGEQVKTEACADMAGVACMLRLGAQDPDFDYDAFFRAYARLWAQNVTPDTEYYSGVYDVHPVNYVRVNTVVTQFDEFYETYEIGEGDGMYIEPEDRVKIW